MSNRKLDGKQIRDVLRLHIDDKFSQRKIEKSLNISRKSICLVINRFNDSHIVWPLSPIIDDAVIVSMIYSKSRENQCTARKDSPDFKEVHESMKLKGASLQEIHREYLLNSNNGMSYSRFCTLYREYKLTLKRSLRQTHIAGEKVFVDYAGHTVKIHLSPTQVMDAQIFVGVLGASNYIFSEAVWRQTSENWLGSHVRMFEHFGGVPQMVVCDNLKAGVSMASRTNPIVQSEYADLARHYKTIIFPARAYKPQDKSKAEGGVLIVERWILFRIRKTIFTSIEQLNEMIEKLLVEINNRPFQKLEGTRKSRLDELDRPAFKQLPTNPYQYRQFLKARVGHDYHVLVDSHYYSVPHAMVRKKVDVILSQTSIEIFYESKRIAIHPRSYIKGQKTTLKEHMPDNHRQFIHVSEESLLWAESVGLNAFTIVQKLIDHAQNQSIMYRQIQRAKSLAKQYGNERFESACFTILKVGGHKLDAIASVLENNLDKMNDKSANQHYDATFDHQNIRGSRYYH